MRFSFLKRPSFINTTSVQRRNFTWSVHLLFMVTSTLCLQPGPHCSALSTFFVFLLHGHISHEMPKASLLLFLCKHVPPDVPFAFNDISGRKTFSLLGLSFFSHPDPIQNQTLATLTHLPPEPHCVAAQPSLIFFLDSQAQPLAFH